LARQQNINIGIYDYNKAAENNGSYQYRSIQEGIDIKVKV